MSATTPPAAGVVRSPTTYVHTSGAAVARSGSVASAGRGARVERRDGERQKHDHGQGREEPRNRSRELSRDHGQRRCSDGERRQSRRSDGHRGRTPRRRGRDQERQEQAWDEPVPRGAREARDVRPRVDGVVPGGEERRRGLGELPELHAEPGERERERRPAGAQPQGDERAHRCHDERDEPRVRHDPADVEGGPVVRAAEVDARRSPVLALDADRRDRRRRHHQRVRAPERPRPERAAWRGDRRTDAAPVAVGATEASSRPSGNRRPSVASSSVPSTSSPRASRYSRGYAASAAR
jgi:hypothetical protein